VHSDGIGNRVWFHMESVYNSVDIIDNSFVRNRAEFLSDLVGSGPSVLKGGADGNILGAFDQLGGVILRGD